MPIIFRVLNVNLKETARAIKKDILTLYFALRDKRTPWYAKVIIGLIVGYALSPIDLIPDFIPIIGYLDDIIILPLGILLALRLIPTEVIEDCRKHADDWKGNKPKIWTAGIIVVFLWVILFSWIILTIIGFVR